MKSSIVFALILGIIGGCASTTHFSKEYSTGYVLRSDTIVGHCQIFTGAYSLYFGIENALCLGQAPGYVVMKSGARVKVNRLYQLGGLDAFYDSAELSVLDDQTGKTITVYLKNWVDKEKFLEVR